MKIINGDYFLYHNVRNKRWIRKLWKINHCHHWFIFQYNLFLKAILVQKKTNDYLIFVIY